VSKAQTASFSRRSFKWLKRAITNFLRSGSGRTAKCWIASLVLLMVLMNAMNVANSYVLRDFMSAIQNRNHSGFVYYAWAYAGVFAISTVISVLLRFSEERLGL
jgi:vitamin B12/bleomycin/antimicrobial peptide transport system ATP-binding/permease protein